MKLFNEVLHRERETPLELKKSQRRDRHPRHIPSPADRILHGLPNIPIFQKDHVPSFDRAWP